MRSCSFFLSNLLLNSINSVQIIQCDMREHSDWLRVILRYKSVKYFILQWFLLKTSAHRKLYLKEVEIAKKVHIIGLNNENIKQLIYFFGTDKGTNRLRNT